MNYRTKVIVVAVIVCMVAGAFFFLSRKTSKTDQEIKIIQPQIGTIRQMITTTATILPKNRLAIKLPVNGRVEKVLVKEGELVKPGQVLAQMSSSDRAALLDAARGQGEKEYQYWQDVYKPIPLLAPIEGQVIVATTQPGQAVTTADEVIVLSDRLIVRAQVDETDIGKIKTGQEAVISLDAYPEVSLKARVDHLYYESKTVSNVTIYEVDIIPEGVPEFFRSGMNANVDFIINEKKDILVLPLAAVTRRKDESSVMLKGADQKKPVIRQIETGISDERRIEIVSGLSEEDQVIVTDKLPSNKRSMDKKNPFMPQRPKGSGGRRP